MEYNNEILICEGKNNYHLVGVDLKERKTIEDIKILINKISLSLFIRLFLLYNINR